MYGASRIFAVDERSNIDFKGPRPALYSNALQTWISTFVYELKEWVTRP